MTLWDLAAVASKTLGYGAMVAAAGGLLIALLQPGRWLLERYTIPAAAVGVLAVSSYFFIHIGQVNQQGWAGMFDLQMGIILGETPVGDGLRLRMAGFAGLLVASVLLLLSDNWSRIRHWVSASFALGALAMLMLAISFAVLGHVASQPLVARAAVTVHIVVISLWAGALWPLMRLCDVLQERPAELLQVMRRFSTLAAWLLGLMLVSGVCMALYLIDDPADILGSAYGRLLLGKIVVVGGMMALGAANKYIWVVQLERAGNVIVLAEDAIRGLRRSIRVELLLALLVLLATALLTTLQGPPAAMS